MFHQGHNYDESFFCQALNSGSNHIGWFVMSCVLLERKSCDCCRVVWGLWVERSSMP